MKGMLLWCGVLLFGCTKSEGTSAEKKPVETAAAPAPAPAPEPTAPAADGDKPAATANVETPAAGENEKPTPVETAKVDGEKPAAVAKVEKPKRAKAVVEKELFEEIERKYPKMGCGGVRVTDDAVLIEAKNPEVLDDAALEELKKASADAVGESVEVKITKS